KLWVTDNERIEAVVYDLARAVEMSDADRVMGHLTPDVDFAPTAEALGATPYQRAALYVVSRFAGQKVTRSLIESQLRNYRFDYVRVTHLTTHAGQQSRLGTAEFRVHVMGEQLEPYHAIATAPVGTDWSLGFRETEPHVWKVDRVSLTKLPDKEA